MVALLERAIRARAGDSTGFRVSALANDTVGVLAAGAYLDPRCDMGLIVGTGANLAVAVSADMIGRQDLSASAGSQNEMIFNMECGNFDGVASIQTNVDRALDLDSDTEGQLTEENDSGAVSGRGGAAQNVGSRGERRWI